MRPILTMAVLALTVLTTAPLHGQHDALNVASALAAPPEAMPPRAREWMDIGERHHQAFRLERAEAAYREAARVEEQAGRFPADALWKLAYVQYGRQRRAAAARTLDHLAGLAERYGQPAVQARSLLEAVILHHMVGDDESARRSLARLLPLRQSSHLPAELREEIRRRLGQ